MSRSDSISLSADSPGTPDRWLVLTIVSLDYVVLYVHRSMLGFLKEPMSNGLGLSPDQYGWLYNAFYLPYTVTQLAVGYLGDRLSRRSVLLWSLCASVLALAGMGLAANFWQMVGLRVLLGVGQAASVPAIASALADSFTPRTRSRAISIYLIPYTLGLIPAAAYGGRVADTPVWHIHFGAAEWAVAGWRMALLLSAAGGAAAAVLFLLLFREPPRTERDTSSTSLPLRPALRAVLRVPTFQALLAAFVLYSTTALAVQYWLPGYLQKHFERSQAQANLWATLWLQSGTVLGLFLGGRLGDRLGKRWWAGRTTVQMGGLVLMTPSLVVVGTAAWDVLPVPLLLFGLGVGLYMANLWATAFEVVRPETRSTAIGLMNVASGVFGFWCNPLIGKYEKHGGSVGTALASLSVLLAVTLVVLVCSTRWLLPRDYRVPT
jgi:MFS family permease